MSDLAGILTSTVGGSLIGGIGAIVGKWLDAKEKAKERTFKLQEMKLANDHEMAMANTSGNLKLAELDKNLTQSIMEGEYKGLEASIHADRATYSQGTDNKWLIAVDVFRGSVRPLLTATLLVYLMFALWHVTNRYGAAAITNEQLYNLLFLIINCLVTSANIALTWWFGSRITVSKTGG